MKRLATLFILTILVTTAGFAKPKHKDLSGNIAIKGELTKEYQQSPAGTPVIIRRVVKMNNPGENSRSGNGPGILAANIPEESSLRIFQRPRLQAQTAPGNRRRMPGLSR